ncbi:hypothetical protein [Streptomyces sp. NBC_01794]|uniref:hypothetical protein n=1 Tax=Streptomyces sp. NBC_01794 TaxID=2975942 RepID=UPI0030928F54|nr:hypothetical protein OIE54_35210 [Streptomyces sp. NBC_01794]
MTLQYATTSSGGRRLAAPAPEESVPHPADPPIYRELLRKWASKGQTLPGRRDPEWSRLAAPPVWDGRFSTSQDQRVSGPAR